MNTIVVYLLGITLANGTIATSEDWSFTSREACVHTAMDALDNIDKDLRYSQKLWSDFTQQAVKGGLPVGFFCVKKTAELK